MSSTLILPMFNTVLLPDVDYRLSVEHISDAERSRIQIDEGRAIFLPMRTEKSRQELTKEDFFPLGIIADISQIQDGPMGTVVEAQAREKIHVTEITITEGIIEGEYEAVDEVMDVTFSAEKKLLEALKKLTTEMASQIRGGEYAVEYLKKISTINEFAAVFCQFFDMTPEEKYALLETNSFKERGMLVRESVLRFRGALEVQIELANAEDPEGTAYRKAAIHKQIGVLEKALAEMEGRGEDDEDSFEKRIEAAGMPDDVRKEVERVLARFNREPSNGAEYNSLYGYLDFVTSLKWQIDETPKIDLKKARKIMDRDHYGLKKVKERILQHLAVMALHERSGGTKQKGTILLLVGAPGTGKTSMGRSVAEALGRKYVRISLGGIRDEAEIRGHRRTYIGALPGRIMDGIKRSGAMNPVVVLDEVDKLHARFDGDPSAALLEVLDPEQNTSFEDHYVNLPYDL